MTEGRVSGGYYSQNYLRASTPSQDSERMRFRIAKYLDDYFSGDEDVRVGIFIEKELGLPVLKIGASRRYVNWEASLNNCSLSDFLDVITAICRIYPQKSVSRDRATVRMDFAAFAERVFREQNVAYRLDEKGGVHPFVDAAFTAEISELIRGLSNTDLVAAREHIISAEKALLLTDPDTRLAVRASFDAIENVFRLAFPKCDRLSKHFVEGHLLPLVQSSYPPGDHEIGPMEDMVNGFYCWIKAGHAYRHEPGKPEVTAPTMEFAVQYVSHGFGYARWLAAIYIATKP